MQTQTELAQGVFASDDSRALRSIYAEARRRVDDCIAVDAEIERRLAVIVLYVYGAQAGTSRLPAAAEGTIAQTCADRLLARTAAV